MNNDIKKLVTKHNPRVMTDDNGAAIQYEFTLYRRFIDFYVNAFRCRYGMLQGWVNIETYGLIARVLSEQNEEIRITEQDRGPLSAQQYEVNALMQALCKIDAPSIEKINHEITFVTPLWNNNQWGSPFGKLAEKKLIQKYRAEHQIAEPMPKSTDQLQMRRNKLHDSMAALRKHLGCQQD